MSSIELNGRFTELACLDTGQRTFFSIQREFESLTLLALVFFDTLFGTLKRSFRSSLEMKKRNSEVETLQTNPADHDHDSRRSSFLQARDGQHGNVR